MLSTTATPTHRTTKDQTSVEMELERTSAAALQSHGNSDSVKQSKGCYVPCLQSHNSACRRNRGRRIRMQAREEEQAWGAKRNLSLQEREIGNKTLGERVEERTGGRRKSLRSLQAYQIGAFTAFWCERKGLVEKGEGEGVVSKTRHGRPRPVAVLVSFAIPPSHVTTTHGDDGKRLRWPVSCRRGGDPSPFRSRLLACRMRATGMA